MAGSPLTSLAVHVTVDVPTLKLPPDGGKHATVPLAHTSEFAATVGVVYVAAALPPVVNA